MTTESEIKNEAASADLSKIIERVRKLLHMAGNNANEHEALNALDMAHTLLAKHNLSMAEIEKTKSNAKEKRYYEKTVTNLSEVYFRQLFDKVGKLYFCSCVYNRPNPHKRETIFTMIGREVNVILATEMALYLSQTMKRLCNDAVKRSGDKSNAFRDSFLKGMINRLWYRITEMQTKPPEGNTKNALVLFMDEEEAANRDFMSQLFNNVKHDKGRKSVIKNGEAYYAGRDAANSVNFDRQVKHEKKLAIGN